MSLSSYATDEQRYSWQQYIGGENAHNVYGIPYRLRPTHVGSRGFPGFGRALAMRGQYRVRGIGWIALLACAACGSGPTGPEPSVISALRWYNRWIDPLALRPTKFIDCELALFRKKGFAYCQPGSIEIEFETPVGSPPIITHIGPVFTNYSKTLHDFKIHQYPGGSESLTTRHVSIPTSALGECMRQEATSKRIAETTVSAAIRTDLSRQGITLRFPLACEGDPFYLVYFMKGSSVEWIWQVNDKAEPVWEFTRGNLQRRIPDAALRNISKPELWYLPR
jgi:hypothetical protein